MSASRIPVTILTGFLGAGKTTTLNNIIRQSPDKRIVIIENEFGEINIDNELVINVDEGVYEMSNGCVCCTMAGELDVILEQIHQDEKKTDHLIIETTGLADPGPVALRFLSDFNTQIHYRLDGVICLVDAQFIRQQLNDTVETVKQLAQADLVVLNKTDKASEEEVTTLLHLLNSINPQAQLVLGQFGQVSDIELLKLNAYEAGQTVVNTERAFKEFKVPGLKLSGVEKPEPSKQGLFGQHNLHLHTAVGSCAIRIKEPMDLVLFDRWMGMFLMANARNVFRVKGFINVQLIEKRLIFQSVHDQFACEEGETWKEGEAETKLVFIGKQLDHEQIERGLRQCIFNERKIIYNI